MNYKSRHSTPPNRIEMDGIAAHSLKEPSVSLDMFRNGVLWGLRYKGLTAEKYHLIPENGLYRIKSLIDISNFRVKVGDLGGLVESYKTLSHDGMCWITKDAIVTGNARIYDNAYITGTAQVGDNAVIAGNARIDNGEVFDQAVVSESASVLENGKVFGKAQICRTMQIRWSIEKTPLSIILPDSYTMTLDSLNGKISLAGQYFSFDEIEVAKEIWMKLLTDEQINDRLDGIAFLEQRFKKHRVA